MVNPRFDVPGLFVEDCVDVASSVNDANNFDTPVDGTIEYQVIANREAPQIGRQFRPCLSHPRRACKLIKSALDLA